VGLVTDHAKRVMDHAKLRPAAAGRDEIPLVARERADGAAQHRGGARRLERFPPDVTRFVAKGIP